MTRKLFGLDLFDVAVHVMVTGGIAGIVGEMNSGRVGDVLVTGVLITSLLVLAYRRKRAMAHAGTRQPEAEPERLNDLEYRVAELEQTQQRVLELEERLDFAERLLAKSHERELLK
jgi:hypothetical protein